MSPGWLTLDNPLKGHREVGTLTVNQAWFFKIKFYYVTEYKI